MPWISEAQKHYEEYVDYYTSLLEGYVEDRIVEMAPAYGELQEAAVRALDEITLKYVNESNPDFVPTRRWVKKIQEEYLTKIIPELNLLNAKLQPYATSVICGTVFYGANTTAYILERAARCAVTVPSLTSSGVLGIIANPWLPDGKNYSARIHKSVSLVADKSQETVKKLVTNKMQYSDAAKELSAAIDESYYNGSRIIRTEMTRANGLGASYSMMENADIVEGKYRDATFDSKTSAYCAADADYSKRHPYDVDYDTPINPGLPGRRIPNHPNCRCRWVSILSALGIQTRQKAALDKDGQLYYSKAGSYDEYAKEVGLPSVKDMVNADNPKKYLRPGETMEDLRRDVQRKTFDPKLGEKTTITVPNKSCLIDKNMKDDILTVKKTSVEPLSYTRKTKNTGVYASLEEPLQKRHVDNVIKEASYDYSGITIKVRHDKDLLGTGFLGYTHSDGKTVELYPDTFTSRETLVKTLAHERKHVEQVRLHGPTTDTNELVRRETEAYGIEAEAWEKYKKGRR